MNENAKVLLFSETDPTEQIIITTSLITQLFLTEDSENISQKVVEWMTNPNDLLFDKSPIEVCSIGEGAHLIKWLKDRL